jgi:L-lactate dehydrogenase complex protein LldF
MTDHLAGTTFESRSREQLAKAFQRRAIPAAVDGTVGHMGAIFADADREGLRDLGQAIRGHAVANAAALVGQLAASLERNGARVHFAADATEANRIVVDICRAADARRVVKSKSMLSEELELNPALEAAGLDVVETDLGEYIIQLDHDRPSHIIGPAIHKTRGEVHDLFSRVAGSELADDAFGLTDFARGRLRQEFLDADVGITGANFGIAETGTIVLVENEGNARLTTSLPRVHIALMGVERVVPRLEDLGVLLPLLVGHGTGQRISTYVSLVDGPRQAGEPDGPEEMHVVIVDGGRSAVLGTDYQEILQCIRCGACQNVCPVYRQVGGHAYGWVYGGPIGAVLTPLFRTDAPEAAELSQATSLCGACDDACPVRIPLHDLLLRLRRDRAAGSTPGRFERLAYRAWSYTWSVPILYRLSGQLGRVARGPLARRGPLSRWTDGRDLTLPAARPFHRRKH